MQFGYYWARYEDDEQSEWIIIYFDETVDLEIMHKMYKEFRGPILLEHYLESR